MSDIAWALRYTDPKQPYWIGIWGERKIAEMIMEKHGKGVELVQVAVMPRSWNDEEPS